MVYLGKAGCHNFSRETFETMMGELKYSGRKRAEAVTTDTKAALNSESHLRGDKVSPDYGDSYAWKL